ncbi:hypothetical protein Adt_35070 [Abeliophyllum distichum]|uniref:Uncharacterized protein n=1 Tax=Abeliophyllum distichum TaxID=126358 RepID=A0ABD1QDN4_9LAMI
MAEINTAMGHVLNFELYKVLTRYDEMREMAVAKTRKFTKENTKLSSKNEVLHSKMEYVVSVEANLERWTEEKLKVYKEMAFVKHKQLAEVMAELTNSKEQLARLEASTCANPKEATGF